MNKSSQGLTDFPRGAVLGKLFDVYALKTVSFTDKDKNAYVVSKEQAAVIESTGRLPDEEEPYSSFSLRVLGIAPTAVEASYYASKRKGSLRRPELRMGKAFINKWVDVGDRVLFGALGTKLFVIKLTKCVDADDAIARAVAAASPATILAKAMKVFGPPKTAKVSTKSFVRNPLVIAGALSRAKGKCQMPGCTAALFHRDDGSTYLEVHHLKPLAENGFDEMANVAAICPACHREMHHGRHRFEKRTVCTDYITGKEKSATPGK